MNRMIAFLEKGNGGLRTLITIGGILVSLLTGVFIAGGIWWDLRTSQARSAETDRELLLEIKGLRKDMTDVKTEVGLNSFYRQEHPKQHEAEDKRIDRLERYQDRRP